MSATFLLVPANVQITVPNPTLRVGTTTTASAAAAAPPGNVWSSAFPLEYEWRSSNPAVATVSSSGGPSATVYAASQGSAQITATARGRTSNAVTVSPSPSQAAPTFVQGTFYGGDGVTTLPGMAVGISRGGTAVGSAITDALGRFRIGVTPGGNLSLFASGVCDPQPERACRNQRSFNSTDHDPFTVQEGQDFKFDPQARSGYHLSITGGFQDRTVLARATFQLQLRYEVWNRANLPGASPRIIAGIEATPGPNPPFLQPGAYPPGATGTTNLTLTAPATPGTYGVYVLLVTATASVTAPSEYLRLFPNGRFFIRVLTLTVTP